MKRIETKFHVRLPFTCIYEPESHAVSTDCALSAAHDRHLPQFLFRFAYLFLSFGFGNNHSHLVIAEQ